MLQVFDLRYTKDYICLDSMTMINAKSASIARITDPDSQNGEFTISPEVRQSVETCLPDTAITDIDLSNKHYKSKVAYTT